MPPKINGRNTKDIILKGVGVPTYKSLDKFLNAFGSAGIFEGGTITDSGSGQIDIAAAKGVIRTTDSELGELVSFDIAATTDVSLTDNSMNYVYINYNSGVPTYAVTTNYDSINLHSMVIVGRVYRMGTTLYISNVGQDIQDTTLRDLYRIQATRKMEHSSGAVLSFVAATRQPTVTAGVYFSSYDKISTSAFDASGSGRFTAWYRNGSGGWTSVTSQQNVDNLNYDNGTGTLTALGVSDYGVHWVYQLVDGTIHIQYGQASYTSLANARAATVPSTQPSPVTGLGTLIGRIIILKSATTIYETSSAFDITFTGSAATSHNDLANIQGGIAGEYYHLSSANLTDLTDAGDSTLHYHATDRALANATGTLAVANGGTGQATRTAAFDALAPSGAAQGDILYFNGTNWVLLTAGTSGYYLKTQGAAANPIWAAVATLPSGTQGDIIYYNGSAWVVLSAGTNGYYLKTQGAGANPVWAAVSASGSTSFRRYIEGECYTTVLMYYRVNSTLTISEARATLGALPTGQSLKVDVRKNGTATTNSIFSSDTPIEITTGASATNGVYTATGTLDSGQTACSAGDILYVVITQVGSTLAGADLEVVVSF